MPCTGLTPWGTRGSNSCTQWRSKDAEGGHNAEEAVPGSETWSALVDAQICPPKPAGASACLHACWPAIRTANWRFQAVTCNSTLVSQTSSTIQPSASSAFLAPVIPSLFPCLSSPPAIPMPQSHIVHGSYRMPIGMLQLTVSWLNFGGTRVTRSVSSRPFPGTKLLQKSKVAGFRICVSPPVDGCLNVSLEGRKINSHRF